MSGTIRSVKNSIVALFVAASLPGQQAQEPGPQSWPQFRGPQASGVAAGFATATKWNVPKGQGIQWRTAIPGMAHSSPVISGDRIYLTTAVRKAEGDAELIVGLYGSIAPVEDEGAHDFEVLCVDRRSGEILWSQTAWQGVPAIPRHPKGSHAASTPATDGEHVVAFFGSEGLYAYDKDGKLLWKKSFGVLDSGFFMVPKAQWGFGSSPVIHEGRVYVQCDVQKDSFVAALDVKTGEEIWRTAREEVPTWSTPTVHVAGGRRLLLLNGYKRMAGYELDTGKEVWHLSGGGDIPVPTPVVAHGLVFITNAHGRIAPILAISTAAEGELAIDAKECAHMAWSETRRGNYMQTPLVYGDKLYLCADAGVLTCIDARSGEQHYRQRIEGGVGFTASGVAADGKLYFTSEEGDVYVVKAGKEYEELSVNPLGEICMATPAIVEGSLYFRTRGHLVAIAPGQSPR